MSIIEILLENKTSDEVLNSVQTFFGSLKAKYVDVMVMVQMQIRSERANILEERSYWLREGGSDQVYCHGDSEYSTLLFFLEQHKAVYYCWCYQNFEKKIQLLRRLLRSPEK
ncbi:unnamed protein product [Amaranthus hypochondriacus]